MPVSAFAFHGQPDFLPTTAGSLCQNPHLRHFRAAAGTLGQFRASEDTDRPSSAQTQQQSAPRADRIFCSSFPAKQNGALIGAPFCFLLSDRFMHRREHQRLPALRKVGRCVCSAALAPSSKRNCCAGTSSACRVALTTISSSRRNA